MSGHGSRLPLTLRFKLGVLALLTSVVTAACTLFPPRWPIPTCYARVPPTPSPTPATPTPTCYVPLPPTPSPSSPLISPLSPLPTPTPTSLSQSRQALRAQLLAARQFPETVVHLLDL